MNSGRSPAAWTSFFLAMLFLRVPCLQVGGRCIDAFPVLCRCLAFEMLFIGVEDGTATGEKEEKKDSAYGWPMA